MASLHVYMASLHVYLGPLHAYTSTCKLDVIAFGDVC
jgi:hypothetical protein